MQTITISDDTLNQLNDLSSKEHISANILIEQLINKYAEEKKPVLLTDFAGTLANSPSL